MSNLYQKDLFDINDNIILVSQLRSDAKSGDIFEAQVENQPRVANFNFGRLGLEMENVNIT
ncbi:9003_t:CDS:1, partial [Funneliformis geosporum]